MSGHTKDYNERASSVSSSARRMRRFRRRRRRRLRCLWIELREEEVRALIGMGLLLEQEQENKTAIRKALYVFLDRTFSRKVTP